MVYIKDGKQDVNTTNIYDYKQITIMEKVTTRDLRVSDLLINFLITSAVN